MGGIGSGRKRLPKAVKEQRGTHQPCRDNPNAPHVEASKVPPPPKMHRGEREVWLELAGQVEALGTYATSDYASFRLMVEAVAATRSFAKDASAGAKVATQKLAAGLLASFGLVPASRDKVSAAKRQVDDAAGFLFAGAPQLTAVPGGKA